MVIQLSDKKSATPTSTAAASAPVAESAAATSGTDDTATAQAGAPVSDAATDNSPTGAPQTGTVTTDTVMESTAQNNGETMADRLSH